MWFSRSQISHFLFIYLPYIERRTLYFWHTVQTFWTLIWRTVLLQKSENVDPILVTPLPKMRPHYQTRSQSTRLPHYSQSSCESGTPSSGSTSLWASYKEVPPPPPGGGGKALYPLDNYTVMWWAVISPPMYWCIDVLYDYYFVYPYTYLFIYFIYWRVMQFPVEKSL